MLMKGGIGYVNHDSNTKKIAFLIISILSIGIWYWLLYVEDGGFIFRDKSKVDAKQILEEKYKEEFQIISSERMSENANVIDGTVYKVKSIENPDIVFNFYSYQQYDTVGSFTTGKSRDTRDNYIVELLSRDINNFAKENNFEVERKETSIGFKYEPYYDNVDLIFIFSDQNKDELATKIPVFLKNAQERYAAISGNKSFWAGVSVCFRPVDGDDELVNPCSLNIGLNLFDGTYSNERGSYGELEFTKEEIYSKFNAYEKTRINEIERQKALTN